MDVEHISCCKDTGPIRLEILIYFCALCSPVQGYAGIQGKLIFRNQAYRQDQRIAIILFFRSRNRFHMLIYLRNRHTGQTFIPVDGCNRMAQIKGDSIVV